MEEKHYMISDAAKMVDVESHVLRYWEEELKIDIPRNEMGHRYYTDTYIHLFQEIKKLKEQGLLLKAIKMLLPDLMEGKSYSGNEAQALSEVALGENAAAPGEVPCGEKSISEPEEADKEQPQLSARIESEKVQAEVVEKQDNSMPPSKPQLHTASLERNDKVDQFRIILGSIVSQAIENNNEVLGKEVSSRVSDSVIKEMDYLLRLKEEREEERYKKFDELLRNYQRGNRESAATSEKKGMFRRLKKRR